MEFASRAASAESLDEIGFFLTNDLRTLVGYERCFLITHFGGDSALVAATHQPVLEKKSELQGLLKAIASSLQGIDKPLILHNGATGTTVADESLAGRARADLESYMSVTGCEYLCCIPLVYNKSAVGHLLMEYFAPHGPEKTSMMATMKIAPVFAAALTGRWLLEHKPQLAHDLPSASGMRSKTRTRFARRLSVVAACAIALFVLLFLLPFGDTAGGEAVVISREKQFAFCKIGGLIDKVLVRQGSEVKKGQTLATLDPTDLEYQIRREQRRHEILTQDIALLGSGVVEEPSKLVKIRLLDLQRKNVAEELEYLQRQTQFLEIKSPVDGIVVTNDVDTLAGKKLNPGDPFCEIAEPELLAATVYVPDERIMRVGNGQAVDLYLNTNTRKAHKLTVYEIAPRAEAHPRLGNVYGVRAEFEEIPASLRVGMKGIGKITTGTANLWTMFTRRVFTQLNRLALYF